LHESAKPGSKEFSENVATEVEAGKPVKQAVAIAYKEARSDSIEGAPRASEATHRAAGILYKTPEGQALFLKRGPGGDYPGFWCFPGGHLEEGETPEVAAIREAV